MNINSSSTYYYPGDFSCVLQSSSRNGVCWVVIDMAEMSSCDLSVELWSCDNHSLIPVSKLTNEDYEIRLKTVETAGLELRFCFHYPGLCCVDAISKTLNSVLICFMRY